MFLSSEELLKVLHNCAVRWDGDRFATKCVDCQLRPEGPWCKNVMFAQVSKYITRAEEAKREMEKRINELEHENAKAKKQLEAAMQKSQNVCPMCGEELEEDADRVNVCTVCGWMEEKTLEIDCRKCTEFSAEKPCCKIYGDDPEKAVKLCASDGFKHYFA